jgi:hypothetical protein
MIPLNPFFRPLQFTPIHFEKLCRCCWVSSCDIDKSRRCNIVGFALTYKTIILQKILQFRLITLRLSFKDMSCFGSILLVRMMCCTRIIVQNALL